MHDVIVSLATLVTKPVRYSVSTLSTVKQNKQLINYSRTSAQCCISLCKDWYTIIMMIVFRIVSYEMLN